MIEGKAGSAPDWETANGGIADLVEHDGSKVAEGREPSVPGRTNFYRGRLWVRAGRRDPKLWCVW